MSEEEELKELRAYKTGYDLGYFRGVEAMSGKIEKIISLMERSATFKQIVDEAKAKGEEVPFFFGELLTLIADAKALKNELMPTLLIERRAINDLGERIEALPSEAFTGDNLIKLDFKKEEHEEDQGGHQGVLETIL